MTDNEEKRIWGIHTKDDNLFLQNNVIAIGWKEMGNLSKITATREAFKKSYSSVYKNATKASVANSAGILYRFVNEVQIGDYVIFPSRINRQINIGIIERNYIHDIEATEYVQQHKVKWLKHLARTTFSQGALYEVGSAMSFFAVKNYADEYLATLKIDFKKTPFTTLLDDDDSIGATAEEIVESTKDFILKELSKHLKGYELEGFVANLLKAMGYHTIVSTHGGDNGIDITPYKDELQPRILVVIKIINEIKDKEESKFNLQPIIKDKTLLN